MIFRWLPAFCLLMGCALAAFGSDQPRAGRLTGTFEGIEYEYSPGQEELVRLLAQRLAQHNRETAAGPAMRKSDFARAIPLSPGEMLTNRAVYLGRIATLLGLEKVTPLQEECYDAFLDNYEQTMLMHGHMREAAASFQIIKRFTVWDRSELVRRFEAGEKIAGFSYDPATKGGEATFGFNGNVPDERLKELEAKRRKLQLAYKLSYEAKDGVATYRGSFGPVEKAPKPDSAPAPGSKESGTMNDLLPVVIPAELAGTPAEELARILWDGSGDRSLVKMFEVMAGMGASLPLVDPQIAFVLLHETTELGVVDRYFHGTDRRWFCDGVANYVSWRVLRDLHGEDMAARIYNLPEQLKQYADLREQADLRKWPATENQSDEDQHSRLNSARYAFATRAVALMNERAGEDILPRLLIEIGRTKPDKVSIKTVEKAWKKLTGTTLDSILVDAVKPLPATAKPAG